MPKPKNLSIKFDKINKATVKGKVRHSRTGACTSKGKSYHGKTPEVLEQLDASAFHHVAMISRKGLILSEEYRALAEEVAKRPRGLFDDEWIERLARDLSKFTD